MSKSVLACVQLLFLAGCLTLAVLVVMMTRRTLVSDLIWIGIVAVMTMAVMAVLIRDQRSQDREVDYLRAQFGDYFDYAGFCFVTRPVVADGYCCLDVHYQNRYERDCMAILCAAPSRGFFLTRGKGVSLRLPLQIPGGAVGVVRVPIELPESALGKAFRMDVSASVKYPKHRGRKLRFHRGMGVTKIENPHWERLGLALSVLMAPTLHNPISAPARFEAVFPVGDYRKPTADLVVVPRIIWRPGDRHHPQFEL